MTSSLRSLGALVTGLALALVFASLSAPVGAAEEEAVSEQPSRADLERLPQPPAPASTFSGLSGLIRVPTAEVISDGEARLGVTPAPSRRESPMLGGASTDALTLGLIPGSEIALSLGEAQFGHDFVAHGKIQLRPEGEQTPAIAVGAVDLRRTNLNLSPTYFAVATKHVAGDRAAVTLGVAAGEHSGLLAGVSVRPVKPLELQAEWDTDRVNYGAALRLGRRAVARVAKVDVGTAWTFSYQFPLSYPDTPAPPRDDVGPATAPGPRAATSLIQDDLVQLGLENVQVVIVPSGEQRRLVVSVENRQYTLNEFDAVAAVLPVAARHVGADVEEVAVRLHRRGLATAEVRCPLDAYRRWARGETTAGEFATQVRVQPLPERVRHEVSTSPTEVANRPWLHSDVMLSPYLFTEVGTEEATLVTGWLLQPQVSVPLARGLQADARWKYPVSGALVRGREKRLYTDEALLSYAFQPVRGCLVQVLGGRFSDHSFQEWDGFGAELAAPLGRDGLAHVLLARLDNDELGKVTYAIADYWHQIPRWKVQLRALGGQFLFEDNGWGLDLIRYLGEVQLAAGYRRTGAEALAELRASLPLGPRRQPRPPASVRLRLADTFDYRVRSILGERNFVTLAQRIAKELSVTPNLVDTFFNRDRFSSGFFMIYLEGSR